MDAIENPQPGDIVACYGTDWASRVVSWGTASLFGPSALKFGPSHVAMLCEWRDGPLWIESTTLCRLPCRVRGLHCRGMQAHHPENRLQDYWRSGGRCDLYRLSPIDELSRNESLQLTGMLLEFVHRGLDYDLSGALISGTRALRLTRFLHRDQETVFCSELLAAVLQRLGRMNREDPTRYSPARLLRTLIAQGTYRRVGPIEPVPELLPFR